MAEENKEKRMIKYKDQQCIICGVAKVVIFYVDMHHRDFCICIPCAKELKDRLSVVSQ